MKEKDQSTSLEAIDWNKILNRLKQLEKNMERGFEPTSMDKKRILQIRSRTLAEEIAVKKLSEENI